MGRRGCGKLVDLFYIKKKTYARHENVNNSDYRSGDSTVSVRLLGAIINDLLLCVGAVCRFSRGLSFCSAHTARVQTESERRSRILIGRSQRLVFTVSFYAEAAYDKEGGNGYAAHGQCYKRIKPKGAFDAPRVGERRHGKGKGKGSHTAAG